MQESRRLMLHETLCDILGSRNSYFQPPETVNMKYPAIVYGLDDIPSTHADNGVYLRCRKYRLTLIDHDPDSEIVGKIADLPYCAFNSSYQKDNLNHFVFTIDF